MSMALVAAVTFGGLCITRIRNSHPQGQSSTPLPVRALPSDVEVADVVTGARFQGTVTAPYTLVEFGDYQCGPCARTHQALKKLLPTFNGKVRLAFRHFPLQMHPFAREAALAAEAAGEQGQFWQMHDWLYEHQQDLNSKAVLNHAEALGLDMPRFHKSLQTTARKSLEKDLNTVKQLQLQGTPTLILCSSDNKMRIVSMAELQRGL